MKYLHALILSVLIPFGVNAQWQQTSCPLGTGDGVLALAANGNYVFAGVEGLGVEVSSNSGTSWVTSGIGITSSYITAFTCKGSDVFTGTDAGVFKSANNGGSWSAVNNGLTMPFITCLSNNGTSIFAGAGIGQIFRTDNNGTLWTEVSSGLPVTMSSMVFTFTYKDGNVYAGMTGEGVYKSTNNGGTWTDSNNGMTEPIVHSLIVSGNNILAATEDGLYVSGDDGSSWNLINMGFPYITTYSLAKTGTSLYMGTNKGVFRSMDNGITWDSINTGLTNRRIEILSVGGAYLYAMQSQTGIWRRPLSEIIGVDEIKGTIDASIYPNPATTTLNIIGISTSATAEVFDPNGKSLLSQTLNSQSIDISSLAKGMYFIKLSTKEGSVVRKFVKE
jgi:ligand-binding sensor domain-containing protein